MLWQSIKSGARSFKRAFRIELDAQLLARGNRVLAERYDVDLNTLTPAEHSQLDRDVQEILARSAQINGVKKAKAE